MALRQNQTPTMLPWSTVSVVSFSTFGSFQPNMSTSIAAKAIDIKEQIPRINFPVRSLNCGKNE